MTALIVIMKICKAKCRQALMINITMVECQRYGLLHSVSQKACVKTYQPIGNCILISLRLSKKSIQIKVHLFARLEGEASSQSGSVCYHHAFKTAFPCGTKSVEQMTKDDNQLIQTYKSFGFFNQF